MRAYRATDHRKRPCFLYLYDIYTTFILMTHMELKMSALITVEGNVRQISGKSYTRKIRRDGRIPAILKEKTASDNRMVEINPKWLAKIYATSERTFLLDLGTEQKTVKITDVQVDKIKRIPIHVDLLSV